MVEPNKKKKLRESGLGASGSEKVAIRIRTDSCGRATGAPPSSAEEFVESIYPVNIFKILGRLRREKKKF